MTHLAFTQRMGTTLKSQQPDSLTMPVPWKGLDFNLLSSFSRAKLSWVLLKGTFHFENVTKAINYNTFKIDI